MPEFKLGDEAQDTITGFKGTVVAITEWIHGCQRITLQPKVNKDGEIPEQGSFDAPAIKVTKKKKVKRETKTGGPRPTLKRYD